MGLCTLFPSKTVREDGSRIDPTPVACLDCLPKRGPQRAELVKRNSASMPLTTVFRYLLGIILEKIALRWISRIFRHGIHVFSVAVKYIRNR